MNRYNRWFIILALVYGLLGGLFGLLWLAHPGFIPGHVPRVHGHLMLLGFITFFIYGIGLHVLPRFSGRALFSERLARAQFWLANLGLWGLLAGWLGAPPPTGGIGGLLAWLAMALFALNVVFTVGRGPGSSRPRPAASGERTSTSGGDA